MKYTVLETAAVEASAGLHEIDAEIEQIESRKQSLRTIRESLETVGHDLFTVLSLLSDDKLANGGNEAGALTDAPAAEPAAVEDSEPEVVTAPAFHLEAAASPVAEAAADPAPHEEEPVYAPVATLEDVPAEEHPVFAEALHDAEPEAQGDEHAGDEVDAHDHEQWENENCAPVGVAAEVQDGKAPTFKDLLSQSKPYSLRNDGWPACKPVAQRALRDLL